jgi:WD40 repeat protein
VWTVRPSFVCALVLLCSGLAPAGPHRIGEDGFRVGAEFNHAVLSPDGRVFAVSTDSGCHLLDAATGQVLRSWTSNAAVVDLTFDPAGRLLVLEGTGWVRVYDPRTGEQRRAVLITASARRSLFAFGRREWHDPRFLAGGRFVSTASRLLDTETCQPLTVKQDEECAIASPDGVHLAFISVSPPRNPFKQGSEPDPADARPQAELRLFDVPTGQVLSLAISDSAPIEDISFLPGSNELYARVHEQPTLFNLATGQARPLRLDRFEAGYQGPTWSSDGQRVAMPRFDPAGARFVREWDLRTGALLREWKTSDLRLNTLRYTPDGKLLIWNREGLRLDVHEIGQPVALPRGHREQLTDLAFRSDDMLVTLDTGRVVCRWNLRTGALLDRRMLPETVPTKKDLNRQAPSWSLAPSGTEALLHAGPAVAHFNLNRGRLASLRETPLAADYMSPDGRWLLDWGTGWGQLFDCQEGRSLLLPPSEQMWPAGRDGVPAPFWSPDGRWLALGLLRFWPEDDQRRVRLELAVVKLPTARFFTHINLDASDVTAQPLFTPDGSLLLVERNGCLEAYDPATGALRRQYRAATEGGALLPLAVSPDSRLLLVALNQRSPCPGEACFQLIELASGGVRRRWPVPAGLRSLVPPRFSPNGQWIALPLTDGTVLFQATEDEEAPQLDPATLWRDLASVDATLAGNAVRALARRPDAVRWVAGRLGPELERVDEPHLPAQFWLAELEDDNPARRAAARRHLARRPELIEEVEGALTGPPSPEVRRVLADLREEKAALGPPTREELRRLRIIEALERLKTGAAGDLLARLRRAG